VTIVAHKYLCSQNNKMDRLFVASIYYNFKFFNRLFVDPIYYNFKFCNNFQCCNFRVARFCRQPKKIYRQWLHVCMNVVHITLYFVYIFVYSLHSVLYYRFDTVHVFFYNLSSRFLRFGDIYRNIGVISLDRWAFSVPWIWPCSQVL
jgi:hypothetical protein